MTDREGKIRFATILNILFALLQTMVGLLTAHVIVDEKLLKSPDGIRKKIKDILKPFNIEHSTLEIESDQLCSGIGCGLQPNKNV